MSVIPNRYALDVEQFWSKVKYGRGCWEWQGGHTGAGYGAFSMGRGRLVGAHRFAWELLNGPIPNGLCVLHRCDNPGCVRPDHLFLGTHRDNAIDREEKGRSQTGDTHWTRTRVTVLRGSAHGRTHLTEDDIRNIRERLDAGEIQRVLAAEYGVGQVTISEIKLRKTWSHI